MATQCEELGEYDTCKCIYLPEHKEYHAALCRCYCHKSNYTDHPGAKGCRNYVTLTGQIKEWMKMGTFFRKKRTIYTKTKCFNPVVCDTCDGDGWLEFAAIIDYDNAYDIIGGLIGEGEDRILLAIDAEVGHLTYLCYICDGYGVTEEEHFEESSYLFDELRCGLCDELLSTECTIDEGITLQRAHLQQNIYDEDHYTSWKRMEHDRA